MLTQNLGLEWVEVDELQQEAILDSVKLIAMVVEEIQLPALFMALAIELQYFLIKVGK